MQKINDFYLILNSYLTKQKNIQQCIIKDYAVNDEGQATCTAIVPNAHRGLKEMKNIVCYIGSAVDITFENYMQGILLRIPNQYANAQRISQQNPSMPYDYFDNGLDSLIAIVIPHSETIGNILSINLKAKESFTAKAPKCYVGSEEVNVLDELSEYLKLLKEFFDNVAQAAPTISQLPADGSAKLAMASQQMGMKTQEIYDKITEITKPAE